MPSALLLYMLCDSRYIGPLFILSSSRVDILTINPERPAGARWLPITMVRLGRNRTRARFRGIKNIKSCEKIWLVALLQVPPLVYRVLDMPTTPRDLVLPVSNCHQIKIWSTNMCHMCPFLSDLVFLAKYRKFVYMKLVMSLLSVKHCVYNTVLFH
jgi:hypothetical protein